MATTLMQSFKELASKPIFLPLPKLPRIKLQRFAYLSWWTPVFFGLAAFNVLIMVMIWFVFTARNGSFMVSVAAFIANAAAEPTAGGICGMMISVVLWSNTLTAALAGIVLFRRLRMQVSLLEVMIVVIALGYLACGISGTPVRSTEAPEFHVSQVGCVYGVVTAAFAAVLFLHTMGCQMMSIRAVLMGLAMLGGIYIPALLFLIPQAILSVAACIGAQRKHFPTRGDIDDGPRRIFPRR